MMREFLRATSAAVVAVLGRLIQRFTRNRPYSVRLVPELPARMARDQLYVVGENNQYYYASMACPKGSCKIRLNMNLLPDDHPVWTLKVDELGRPTLHPSVWRKRDCGCHFVMRAGKLVWCE